MAQPANGAMNCIGAGSEAVAAMMMEYSIAPLLFEDFHQLGDSGTLLTDSTT
jgi:hypothetical protein